MDLLQTYYPALTEDADNVLGYLGLNLESEEEKKEVISELMAYFNRIIIETIIENLSEKQAASLSELLKQENSGQALEEAATEYAASIPDLAVIVDHRLQSELELLKAQKEILDRT